VPPLATTKAVDSPAAVPEVFWSPAEFTPGKVIAAEPLKFTPPIALAVVNVAAEVADVALPDNAPAKVVAVIVLIPVTVPVMARVPLPKVSKSVSAARPIVVAPTIMVELEKLFPVVPFHVTIALAVLEPGTVIVGSCVNAVLAMFTY
jgi:hypothetical protein